MTTSSKTDPDFAFVGATVSAAVAQAQQADPLGPLSQFVGDEEEAVWTGKGFNTIWRPHDLSDGGQDRFLELNLTTEKLAFTKIPGEIPNRGLLMPDINMFGLTYLQQIHRGSEPNRGLHIEPGIWVNIPTTSNPAEPPTVARLASIPHGTVILAQGAAHTISGGPQIAANNIIPFAIGGTPPPNSAFAAAEAEFPELNLAVKTPFREAPGGVDQALVENPNGFLQKDIDGKDITETTVLSVSTTHTPISGGGTANTAFLEAAANPPGGNAKAVEVHATFWIETIAGTQEQPATLQLQYTQLVQLDFNGLRWPHVTVATLHKA